MEVVISSLDWRDLCIDFLYSFCVGASGCVLSFTVQPFAIFFKELKNWWDLTLFCELLVRVGKVFFPLVQERLKFILTFISFENDSVLVEHFTFESEIFLELLFGVSVELLSFELNWMMGLFLSFLDFNFLFHWLRLVLSGWLFAFLLFTFLFILLFIFLFILFGFLFLWGFNFFSPFFN